MKKLLLSTLILISSFTGICQITDTVSTGASYANQVWYSLANDEQGNAPKDNWDLAFGAGGFSTAIHINSVSGTELWIYPNGNAASWANVDTTGLWSWPKLYNSDTSWEWGAFDVTINYNNAVDYGWGVYDVVTHFVNGDSLYVIKLANGNYKKLFIESMANGIYSFKYADLNGANETTAQIVKSDYAGKNLAYYSLQNNTAIDREPLSTNWDLLFTQYTAFVPAPYTVTGVLHNKKISVAQANGIPDKQIYTDWTQHTAVKQINEIGYDWKSFVGGNYQIKDSLIYFVMKENGAIWKLIMTGFGGTANGNFVFSKEQLTFPTAIDATNDKIPAVMLIYPNPARTGHPVSAVFNTKTVGDQATLSVTDVYGKLILNEVFPTSGALQAYPLQTGGLQAGVYIVTLVSGETRLQQRLLIAQ